VKNKLNTFADVDIYYTNWEDPMPIDLDYGYWDLIISYRSRWIIPKRILKKAKNAINFHPGPSSYRGYGAACWAIYNQDTSFGVLCHFMNEKVDSGTIINTLSVPIKEYDTAFTLSNKAYTALYDLFIKMLPSIQANSFQTIDQTWGGYRGKDDLDYIREINNYMSEKEIDRRIRATTFDKPTAFTMIGKRKFIYNNENRILQRRIPVPPSNKGRVAG